MGIKVRNMLFAKNVNCWRWMYLQLIYMIIKAILFAIGFISIQWVSMKEEKLVMPLSFLLLYIFTLNISLLPILFSKHSFFSHWFLRYKNSSKTEYRDFDCIYDCIMYWNRFSIIKLTIFCWFPIMFSFEVSMYHILFCF